MSLLDMTIPEVVAAIRRRLRPGRWVAVRDGLQISRYRLTGRRLGSLEEQVFEFQEVNDRTGEIRWRAAGRSFRPANAGGPRC